MKKKRKTKKKKKEQYVWDAYQKMIFASEFDRLTF